MNDLNKKRLTRCKWVSRVLASFPFVQCVILNGSLADGNSTESSDIDLLIIAKTKRIFTARFFVNFLATVWGIKRSKDDTLPHSGKYCFNYFLTDKFLRIPTGRGEVMDRYCARNYSKSIFMAGETMLFESFMTTNKALFDQYDCEVKVLTNNYEANRKNTLKRFFEFLLSGKLGDWFEKKVRDYQIQKIESDPRTCKYPNLIVYNDQEMRFHPPKQRY